MKKNNLFITFLKIFTILNVVVLLMNVSIMYFKHFDNKISTIKCKVIALDPKNDMNSIRLLVVSDKETLLCTDLNIFLKLKEDSTYIFKTVGYGKTTFRNYKRIIQIIK